MRKARGRKAGITLPPIKGAHRRRTHLSQVDLAALTEAGLAIVRSQLDVDGLCELVYQQVGRIVAEQLSTGRSEATTRLLLQLELVGLSRLGSNPLKVLKDNILGYRLLREDPDESLRPTFYD